MNTKKQLKKANKLNQELQNQITILNGKIHSLKPHTAVDFQRGSSLSLYFGDKDSKFFGFNDSMTYVDKREILNKRISETIDKYGIIKFEGESLYDMRSLHELREAILIIESGLYIYPVADNKELSKVSKRRGSIVPLSARDYVSDSEIDIEHALSIARDKAETQEEFDTLRFVYTSYLQEKYLPKKLGQKISECINQFGIDKYLNTSLYDIIYIDQYEEALRAIPKMHQLKNDYGVTAYKGTPVEELSEYELDGILLNCKKKDFTDCTISENFKPKRLPAKQKFRKAA